MAACNLGNCTIHEILKCVSEILLVGNDDNTRDDCMIYISVYTSTNLKIYGLKVTRH